MKVAASILSLILIPLFLLTTPEAQSGPEWGFYGHRKINRMAVFTLPQELLAFYKPHLHYITEHAVDPDKRRYALKNEAYRHYIDIDHWDTIPFTSLSRDLKEASISKSDLLCISGGDTTRINNSVDLSALYDLKIYEDRYSPTVDIQQEDLDSLPDPGPVLDCQKMTFYNNFVKYGVLPYFLEDFYKRLVYSFMDLNVDAILKISADMGHYIGDAHVPLHTTENYNGQLSGQLGIHAFWESRIPELYADENYDLLVGKADYIADKKDFFWGIITESHRLLPSVLDMELEVRNTVPEDKQFCYDERLERSTWTQCPEFAKAYEKALEGMVEERMQETILALGSVWLSAWVDAGQPDLSTVNDNRDEDSQRRSQEELEKAVNSGSIFGRPH